MKGWGCLYGDCRDDSIATDDPIAKEVEKRVRCEAFVIDKVPV